MAVLMAQTKKEKTRISEQFRTFRRKNLLRQVELAKLMGVTERTVRNVETGAYAISVPVMKKFAEVQRQMEANQKAGRAMVIPR